MVARIAAIVIVFLLGHDALMAMTPHAETQDPAGHHTIVMQVCEVADGAMVQVSGIPLLPAPDMMTTTVALPAVCEHLANGHPSIFAIDGATQRALLQVFLN